MCRLILSSDMSIQHDVFDNTIDHFSAEEEEIRTAAAFAAGECKLIAFRMAFANSKQGNIAIGNLHLFLPAILKVAEQDSSKRLLSLHALKEVGHGNSSRVGNLLKMLFTGRNALLSRTIGTCCGCYLDPSFP